MKSAASVKVAALFSLRVSPINPPVNIGARGAP
jgi:hypothetical protein